MDYRTSSSIGGALPLASPLHSTGCQRFRNNISSELQDNKTESTSTEETFMVYQCNVRLESPIQIHIFVETFQTKNVWLDVTINDEGSNPKFISFCFF